ncbi:hypothetical protein HID58_090137 [Brassica napus]|uniref:NAD(P)H-quinone oxidoreductase subunit 5, chloroplastic n=1 Tax=Brassica napus TaxID=3708 RepID=A0ABQ7XE89_BRANA|nr:hypothetical protein HID58_090137 [Brassica napus]
MCSFLVHTTYCSECLSKSFCNQSSLLITGSFEFQDLFEIFNNLILNNRINLLFLTCVHFYYLWVLLLNLHNFLSHVWLPDAMEGPTPISALIHAATMVAAGIFSCSSSSSSFYSIITVLLGATLALAQKDIKRGFSLFYNVSTGYMMLALGMGSYRSALFHLITHAYSKALLFLGSGSIIHSMEAISEYDSYGWFDKTCADYKNCLFSRNTLTLWYSPPCLFWSKDEILNDSLLFSPIFAIIACSTAGLTAFYMFRIYLLTFEGHLNTYFINYSGKKSSSFYSISLGNNVRNQTFITVENFGLNTRTFYYPHESDNTILFPMLVLLLFTLFIGAIGIPFNQEGIDFDILSKLLTPSINLLHTNSENFVDWYEFLKNAIFSVSIALFGIFIAYCLYKPFYSSRLNLTLLNSFQKWSSKRIRWENQ